MSEYFSRFGPRAIMSVPNMRVDMDWGNFFRGPAVDLYETENEIIAEVSIPGMDPKKINIEIENNVLSIRSDEEVVSEDSSKDYYRKEVRRGTFDRSIRLPVEVDADKISASSEKGLLKIVMPKSEKAKTKRVTVDIKD
jgi:HSP20 family protein